MPYRKEVARNDTCVDQENQSQPKCERNEVTPRIITTYRCSFFSLHTTFEALQVFFFNPVQFLHRESHNWENEHERGGKKNKSRERNKDKSNDVNQGNYFSSFERSIVIDCLKTPPLRHHHFSILSAAPLPWLLFQRTKPAAFAVWFSLYHTE